MCGIAGIVRREGLEPGDADAVRAMTASLTHRGPDGEGLEVRPDCALGHRRLAVVDLSDQAAQPMASPSGRAWIAYNGEVYNHLELRRELEPERAFSSASDTEAVLAAWERWGDQAVSRLNGMFAFAVWDEASGALHLARDRYGQKPLYWARIPGGGLAFASELRALRHVPGLDLELDPASLAKYLALDTFPGATSPYRGVHKLLPGCTLTWRRGEVTRRRYWRRTYSTSRLSADAASAELWRLLRLSVRRRLMSDVPLGVFLSGGVDSSAVLAAMAAEVQDPRQIKTFAIGFREASFDESEAARAAAAAFGVEHHVHVLDGPRLLELLPEVLDHLDEPLADVSIVPTYALARFARERVTVALGGDGGDELFAGYDTFVADRFARPYLGLPRRAQAAVARAAGRLRPSGARMSLQLRARRFVEGIDPDRVTRNARWFGSFLPEEAAALIHGAPPAEALHEDLHDEPYPDGPSAALDLWTRWYLPDDVLTKVDRASMAVSLEVRAPLLDPELAAFAHALPFRYKLRGLARKWIFKRALRGRLPEALLRRRKQGFGAPNGAWLRGPLRAEVEELLSPRALAATGAIDPELAGRVAREHLSGAADHRKRLWALYVLQRWLTRQGPGS
jgi:asparagine synthase (glutamine-hydrolysing)